GIPPGLFLSPCPPCPPWSRPSCLPPCPPWVLPFFFRVLSGEGFGTVCAGELARPFGPVRGGAYACAEHRARQGELGPARRGGGAGAGGGGRPGADARRRRVRDRPRIDRRSVRLGAAGGGAVDPGARVAGAGAGGPSR